MGKADDKIKYPIEYHTGKMKVVIPHPPSEKAIKDLARVLEELAIKDYVKKNFDK